jgi:hypothetical protein
LVRPREVKEPPEINKLACPTGHYTPVESISLSGAMSNPEPLTGCDHENSDRVVLAADWYRGHRNLCPKPVIPSLRRMFDLTPHEAVEAMRQAHLIWARAS